MATDYNDLTFDLSSAPKGLLPIGFENNDVDIAVFGATFGGGGSSTTTTYYMRALADPGPGYVFWNSFSLDYAGDNAGSAIQAGTAVNIGTLVT